MHLENIRLINFKNYEDQAFTFSDQINCFVGDNGSGKTNLLDAIYYLSLTKSFLNQVDHQNIQWNRDFFSILGDFHKDEISYHVKCSLKQESKKAFSLDNKEYEKLSDHIGLFPVVLITPHDTDIIRGGGEMRRKFFDGIISQVDKYYLNDLISYNHALRQRNSLLKKFDKEFSFDPDLIEPFDIKLVETGTRIFDRRESFLEIFIPIFLKHYENISDKKELVTLKYTSHHHTGNLEDLLEMSREKDRILRRTTIGIHRDDIHFMIDEHPVKKIGSQGQQKSFLVALKLAQFDLMKNHFGFKPIILMDDIFDRLDDHRIEKIMALVASHAFGQLFVTDARPERTFSIFKKIEAERKIFRISSGSAELI
jgi:DNA replication and repair protein RecF